MPEQPDWQKIMRYAFIGTELLATFCLLLFGGLWLDRKLETRPTFTLIGAAGGFGLGLYKLVRDLRRQEQRSQKDRKDGPDRNS